MVLKRTFLTVFLGAFFVCTSSSTHSGSKRKSIPLYSINEPTLDGTASSVYLLAAKEKGSMELSSEKKVVLDPFGAIVRGDTTRRQIALVFTGDEFADGGDTIRNVLKMHNINGSFFLTGRFYDNPSFNSLINGLRNDGNYLGAHSDRHLLYCDWARRDSLLVTKRQFNQDLAECYRKMQNFGIRKKDAPYFLPPYEWYNSAIVKWTKEVDLTLINFSPGTRSAADYTVPEMGKRYVGSDEIFKSIVNYEKQDKNGLNGFLLLIHIGTDPARTDKFYYRLNELISYMKEKRYTFKTVSELLR